MKNKLYFYFLILFLCACNSSASTPMQIVVPKDISPEAKKVVETAWPKVLNTCPGLKRYGNSLVFDSVHDYLDMKKVTVEFKAPDGKSDIPERYRAWGHHCYVDIDSTSNFIAIAKDACQSVCLDQQMEPTGKDLVLNLY